MGKSPGAKPRDRADTQEIDGALVLGPFFTRLLNITAAFSALCILFIAISICYEVLGRYLFNRPLMWTIEVSEYLQIYLVFLSAAWVLRHRGHVTLDIVTDRLKPTWKMRLTILTDMLGAVVAAVFAVFSAQITYEQMVMGIPVIKTLEIPKWVVIAPIPVGMTLLLVEFIIRLIKRIRKEIE